MVAKKTTKSTKTKSVKKNSAPKAEVQSAKVEEKKTSPRKKLSKKMLLFIGAVIILAVFIYVFRGMFVAATVNGEIIPRMELNKQMEKQVGEQTLNDLITKKLILQEMQEKGITATDDEVNAEIKKIETALKEQGRTLDEALATQGITKEDLVEQLRIQKMIEKLFEKDVNVTDAEVEKYMTDNAETLPEGEDPEMLKVTVKEQLRQQKLTEKFQTWLSELQGKATINRFVQF